MKGIEKIKVYSVDVHEASMKCHASPSRNPFGGARPDLRHRRVNVPALARSSKAKAGTHGSRTNQ